MSQMDAEETTKPGWWSQRPTWQKFVLGGLVAVAVLSILVSLFRGPDDTEELAFSEVLRLASEDRIESIEVRATHLEVSVAGDNRDYRSRIGRSTDLVAALENSGAAIDRGGIEVIFHGPSSFGNWFGLFIYCGVLGGFLVAMYFTMRKAVREGIRQGQQDG